MFSCEIAYSDSPAASRASLRLGNSQQSHDHPVMDFQCASPSGRSIERPRPRSGPVSRRIKTMSPASRTRVPRTRSRQVPGPECQPVPAALVPSVRTIPTHTGSGSFCRGATRPRIERVEPRSLRHSRKLSMGPAWDDREVFVLRHRPRSIPRGLGEGAEADLPAQKTAG